MVRLVKSEAGTAMGLKVQETSVPEAAGEAETTESSMDLAPKP